MVAAGLVFQAIEALSTLNAEAVRGRFLLMDIKQHMLSSVRTHTVDGQNPAPPRMMIIPLFIGF